MSVNEEDEMLGDVDRMVRTGVMAAGQIAERAARVHTERDRVALERERAAAADYERRFVADRDVARAYHRQVGDPRFWEKASPQRVAQAFAAAYQWRDHDGQAAVALALFKEGMLEHRGVDVDAVLAGGLDTIGPVKDPGLAELRVDEDRRGFAEYALGRFVEGRDRRADVDEVTANAPADQDRVASQDAAAQRDRKAVTAEPVAASEPAPLEEEMPVAGGAPEPAPAPADANRPGADAKFATEAERAQLQRDVWDASPQQRSAAVEREAALAGLSSSEYRASIQPRQVNDVVAAAMAADRGHLRDVDTLLWNDWRVEQALLERQASGKSLSADKPVLSRREPGEISQRDPYSPQLLRAAAGEAQRAGQTPAQYLDNLEVAHHAQIARAGDPERTAAYNQLRMLSERRVQIAQARAKQSDHDAGRDPAPMSAEVGSAADRTAVPHPVSAPDPPQTPHDTTSATARQTRDEASQNFPTPAGEALRQSHPATRARVVRAATKETDRSQDLGR